jgi:hypothetical protein
MGIQVSADQAASTGFITWIDKCHLSFTPCYYRSLIVCWPSHLNTCLLGYCYIVSRNIAKSTWLQNFHFSELAKDIIRKHLTKPSCCVANDDYFLVVPKFDGPLFVPKFSWWLHFVYENHDVDLFITIRPDLEISRGKPTLDDLHY